MLTSGIKPNHASNRHVHDFSLGVILSRHLSAEATDSFTLLASAVLIVHKLATLKP